MTRESRSTSIVALHHHGPINIQYHDTSDLKVYFGTVESWASGAISRLQWHQWHLCMSLCCKVVGGWINPPEKLQFWDEQHFFKIIIPNCIIQTGSTLFVVSKNAKMSADVFELFLSLVKCALWSSRLWPVTNRRLSKINRSSCTSSFLQTDFHLSGNQLLGVRFCRNACISHSATQLLFGFI